MYFISPRMCVSLFVSDYYYVYVGYKNVCDYMNVKKQALMIKIPKIVNMLTCLQWIIAGAFGIAAGCNKTKCTVSMKITPF